MLQRLIMKPFGASFIMALMLAGCCGVREEMVDEQALRAMGVERNPSEAYVIESGFGKTTLYACTDAGMFYGRQTLEELEKEAGGRLPRLRMVDYPRYEYRGVMLDVSRHFYDKDFIIKQLKLWARLRINRFHWHLTDGTAWRLQIREYPLLTEGVESYTEDDVRDVLRVADSLHITVIPEIEMFGHSEEVRGVYPELFCFGKNVPASEYCLGREATFEFLETVLDRVMALFPSEYIHIGGDEADKSHWARCPDCRKRMDAEGLEDVDRLQSWGIDRISRFVQSRGRRIIGWDEIMDGGLAPGAVVMSWRGTEGGKQAVRMGHKVIMTPGVCYINNCQDAPAFEPVSQGGYLPLKKVFAFDPSEGLGDSDLVAGLQANLWTEYIATPEHMEYMLYPRVFAIAQTGWYGCKGNPDDMEGVEYQAFRQKCLRMLDEIRAEGYNCFDLANERGERPESLTEHPHLARACSVRYADGCVWSDRYNGGGAGALTDGRFGSWDCGRTWQGFLDCDVDVVVDLGAERHISRVCADFGQWETLWIWMPRRVEYSFSRDSVHYSADARGGASGRKAVVVSNDVPEDEKLPTFRDFGADVDVTARYVRIHAPRSLTHRGGWLFLDEILVW